MCPEQEPGVKKNLEYLSLSWIIVLLLEDVSFAFASLLSTRLPKAHLSAGFSVGRGKPVLRGFPAPAGWGVQTEG